MQDGVQQIVASGGLVNFFPIRLIWMSYGKCLQIPLNKNTPAEAGD
jgi:hypothetical protein